MKYKIILLSLLMLILTGCAENSQSEISVSQAEIVTTETSTSTGTQTTAPATTSTTSVKTTESDIQAEKQIVEDVEKAMYGGYYTQSLVDNTVDYMTDRTEELTVLQ